jgi:Flp pilus assembly protein TadG
MAFGLRPLPSRGRSGLSQAAALPRLFAARWPAVGGFAALARDRRGMSAVEFGIAAPVFLAILMPVVDLGRAYSQQIQIRQAVQAGALYASVNVYNSTTWSTNVQNG